jgi:tetratricopeptide (TPR) repeat protein
MKKFVCAVIMTAVCISNMSWAGAGESWDALNAKVIRMYKMKKYTKAIPVAQKALDAAESEHGSDSPQTVLALNNLALLYKKTKKYKAAEPLYLRALTISEKILPSGHPDFAVPLNNLAMYYDSQKHYKKADEYANRAIQILAAAYGPSNPQVEQARKKYEQMKRERA